MQRCFSKSYSTNLHFKWIIELNKSNTFGEVKSPGSKQILKSLEKMKLWQFRQLDFTVIPTLRLPHSVWKQRVNNADNVWAAWLSSGLCERSVVVSRIEVSSWSEALYSVCCDWTQMWTVKYSGTSGRIAFPLLRGCHDKMPVMHRAHKRLVSRSESSCISKDLPFESLAVLSVGWCACWNTVQKSGCGLYHCPNSLNCKGFPLITAPDVNTCLVSPEKEHSSTADI